MFGLNHSLEFFFFILSTCKWGSRNVTCVLLHSCIKTREAEGNAELEAKKENIHRVAVNFCIHTRSEWWSSTTCNLLIMQPFLSLLKAAICARAAHAHTSSGFSLSITRGVQEAGQTHTEAAVGMRAAGRRYAPQWSICSALTPWFMQQVWAGVFLLYKQTIILNLFPLLHSNNSSALMSQKCPRQRQLLPHEASFTEGRSRYSWSYCFDSFIIYILLISNDFLSK